MNIKQFVGIDSHCSDKDGKYMPHEEIYTKVVNAIGLAKCVALLPATDEQLIRATHADPNLNNIPLKKWDDQHPYVVQLLCRIGINTISLSNTVCVLKQAARMHVELINQKIEKNQ